MELQFAKAFTYPYPSTFVVRIAFTTFGAAFGAELVHFVTTWLAVVD